MTTKKNNPDVQGILLVDKPAGKTSFSLVGALRRRLGVKKIGHAGTLDPFATGVMVMLIGRDYTRQSDTLLTSDKEYIGTVRLGISTDSHDCDGEETGRSDSVPSLQQLESVIAEFQGEVQQVPPMFSAKKIGGKKLYDLARKGIEIERQPVAVKLHTELLSYEYPYAMIKVKCSKGTYIRCIANDIGIKLGCGAHLSALQRTQSGHFKIEECIDSKDIDNPAVDIASKLLK